MLPEVFRLRVVILHPGGGERVVIVLPTDRIIDVIARALAGAGIDPAAYGSWELCLGPDPLPPERLVRDLYPLDFQVTTLTLRPGRSPRAEGPVARPASRVPGIPAPPAAAAPAPAPAPPPSPPPSPPRENLPALEVESDEEDEDADRAAAPAPSGGLRPDDSAVRSAPAPRPRFEAAPPPTRGRFKAKGSAPATTERRATVRYYSRMNPERVFPLLVMLTREEVERVVKRHVEQTATGPLKLATDVPLEIEPVLPGCACHPPKITTRLEAKDQVFTFHVVPHVLGEVTGARVVIRQDHVPVAEIELELKVVQRTLVILSGLSTFVLPAASAAMRHFGLDFTPKDGSNPYLAVLNFLFGEIAPVTLTAALAVVTGALWWFTRPKGRDVFFDVSTKPARGRA
jgi:hypothetical protein